jgi:ubiquinone/menaquinone biosynthesis C-methylase UbiE
MKKEIADKILHETEIGYDSISTKFSQTRKHFWRGLESIKDYTRENDKVLDFGCGNGRLLELLGDIENIEYHGVDVSQGLIEFAKKRYDKPNETFTKINPSQTSLAFESNFFNTIYSIAVFHHFPSKKYREEVAKELYEKTAAGGRVIITVWYLWQKKYLKNIFENWKAKVKGDSKLDWNDCLISFTNNEDIKFQRFHHAFTKRELKKLFKNAGFEIEKCQVVDGRNILLVAKKG